MERLALFVIGGLCLLLALRPRGRRLYRTGTRWCVWRWTETDSAYITRLHVVKTPFFAICLHWINKPDPEPYLHDHPVTFLSLILRGGYSEDRTLPGAHGPGDVRTHTHRWWNFIRAHEDDRHTIVAVKPHTLTLCFMGPKRREWGFHTERGWVYWRDYYRAQREAKLVSIGPPEATVNGKDVQVRDIGDGKYELDLAGVW